MSKALRTILRWLGIRRVVIVRVFRGELWVLPPDCNRLGCVVVLTDNPDNRQLVESWFPYPIAYVQLAPPLRYRFTDPRHLRKED